jgi:hypothetical protein
MAVADFSGELSLFRDQENPAFDGHYSVLSESGESEFIETVRCTRLDDYWASKADDDSCAVDALIVDVEGAEYGVFEGAKQVLKQSPNVVILFECTRGRDAIEHLLRELGFSFYQWDAGSRCLHEVCLDRGMYVAKRIPE